MRDRRAMARHPGTVSGPAISQTGVSLQEATRSRNSRIPASNYDSCDQQQYGRPR